MTGGAMSGPRGRDHADLAPAGDSALLVRFGSAVSPGAHLRVMALLRALDRSPPAGLLDLVPAYASLLVLYDPLITTHDAVKSHLRSILHGLRVRSTYGAGRLVRIPVTYGGTAGPDLDDVARLVGLTQDEVVRRHASAEYRVAFLGFLAGFPYLSGLSSELAVPRLSSPRTRVPAGSVALAGSQTGIYPVDAPGGWRIIGRTRVRLFDPGRDPPALLRPGDRVRFEPVPPGATDPGGDSASAQRDAASAPRAGQPEPDALPWLSVSAAGPLTTVQDLGRIGYARYGVSKAGAADADALRLGNLLVGNSPGAAALEVTLGGAAFDVLAPCAVVVTGADADVTRNGRPAPFGEALVLAAGDTIQLGWTRHGVRCYVCVAGGVAVPPVLGSRATDLRAGLGGLDGRALRARDLLWRVPAPHPPQVFAARTLPTAPARALTTADARAIRLLVGPHAAGAPADLDALLHDEFVVGQQSDRVGIRLQTTGSAYEQAIGGETTSEGVPRGAVQLPPNGQPVILLADSQTTGGYRVPAVVATADLWRVAQLRPGDAVRFVLVTLDDAVAALRERDAWLAHFAAHAIHSKAAGAPGYAQPDVALLMRGFTEWSDEEGYDDE